MPFNEVEDCSPLALGHDHLQVAAATASQPHTPLTVLTAPFMVMSGMAGCLLLPCHDDYAGPSS